MWEANSFRPRIRVVEEVKGRGRLCGGARQIRRATETVSPSSKLPIAHKSDRTVLPLGYWIFLVGRWIFAVSSTVELNIQSIWFLSARSRRRKPYWTKRAVELTGIVGIQKRDSASGKGFERAPGGDPRAESIETTIGHDDVRQRPHVYGFSVTGIGHGGTFRGRRRKLRDHGASAKPAFKEFKVGALAARTYDDEGVDLELTLCERLFDHVRDHGRRGGCESLLE